MKWLRNNGRWLFGATGERPATTNEGDYFVDSILGKIQAFVSGAWRDITGHEIKDNAYNTVSNVVVTHDTGVVPTTGFGTGFQVEELGAYAGGIEFENVQPPNGITDRNQLRLYGKVNTIKTVLGTIVSAGNASEPGNPRGIGAVDIQPASAPLGSGIQTNIAAGDYSVLIGGQSNGVIGTGSGVFAGELSHINAVDAVILGGYDQDNNGDYSGMLGGRFNTNNADYGAILGGREVTASYEGEITTGYTDHRNRISLPRRATLTHSSTGWLNIGNFVPESDSLVGIKATVVGTTATLSKRFMFDLVGAVSNIGGTVTLLAHTVTNVYRDDSNFSCQLAVASNALQFQVRDTGSAGDVIRWQVIMTTNEVL